MLGAIMARRPIIIGALAVVAGLVVFGVVYLLGPHQSPSTTANTRTFGTTQAIITDQSGAKHTYCLLVARTAAERDQGLMFVTDHSLGGHAGMLFVFDMDNSTAFWMRNTPLPLSLAYFTAAGALVSTTDMPPCADDADCPTYAPAGAYRYALEVPQGGFSAMGVGQGATLTIGGTC